MSLSALPRLLTTLLAIAGIVLLVFVAVRAVPGDPADVLLGERATEIERAKLRAQMHMEGSLLEQAGGWLGSIGDGSLGTSVALVGRPVAVSTLIAAAMPATLALALVALAWALLLALPLGTMAALLAGGPGDWFGRSVALVGVAMPVFVSGPLGLLLWTVALPWLPTAAHPSSGALDLVLPGAVVGFALAARLSRLLRATLLEQLGGPLASALAARGLPRWRVLWLHLLPNAALPLLPVAAGQLGALVGGALVCEKVFGRVGVGTLLLDAIAARDGAVVQGCVLVIAIGYAVVLGAVDVIVGVIDPRTRLRSAEAQ